MPKRIEKSEVMVHYWRKHTDSLRVHGFLNHFTILHNGGLLMTVKPEQVRYSVNGKTVTHTEFQTVVQSVTHKLKAKDREKRRKAYEIRVGR